MPELSPACAPRARRARPAAPAARAELDVVVVVGQALLLAVVPLSLVWLPLGRIPGAGRISAGDVAQLGLWVLTAVSVLTRTGARLELRAFAIALLAVALGALAGIGSEMSFSTGAGFLEFSRVMKRFGLASIVPLAATRFGSRGTGRWMRAISAAMIGVLVAFILDPGLQDALPRPEDWDPDLFATEQRATGSVTNPNDLAYASIALFILHAAFHPRRPRTLDRVLLGGALAGAAVCLFASGSRSGAVGAAGALAYFVAVARVRIHTKAGIVSAAAAVALAGLSYSSVFEHRLSQAYEEGFGERNVSTRLDAQWIAISAAMRYPAGVGYDGFHRATNERVSLALATSDSVYCDTLLGAGVFGLLCLLALLWTAWRHVGSSLPRGDRRADTLGAGLVAFFLFGAATVVPISVYLAPLFFTIVGAGSLLDGSDAA